MILGPYLTPPPSFVEIHRGVFPEYCSQTNKQTNTQTNKQTNTQKGVKTVTSDLRWRRLKIEHYKFDQLFKSYFLLILASISES